MGIYARDIICVHTDTHTYCLAVALKHSLRRCKNELKKFTASQQLHVPWPLRNLCNAWCGMCQWMTGADPVPQGKLGIPWCQKKMPWRMPSTMKGDIPSKLWCANDTHTHIHIYILWDIIVQPFQENNYSDILSGILSGVRVQACPTAPIWCWGPAGDIDMVFGPRRAPQNQELAIWCLALTLQCRMKTGVMTASEERRKEGGVASFLLKI